MLFKGEINNPSEDRAVTHTLYRSRDSIEKFEPIFSERKKIKAFLEQIHSEHSCKNLICISIGGSRLGPELLNEFQSLNGPIKIYFCSSYDLQELKNALQQCKQKETFVFASSNPMWRASLETLDFIPFATVDYSGGMIITDWYSDGDSLDESVKISIRFLTNEVRADALHIKVFYKKCNQVASCKISQKTGSLSAELKKQILSKATIYKKQNQEKNFKPYKGGTVDTTK